MTTDFIGSLVLGGLDFFTRRYFAFEKEVLSAVSRLYLGRFKPNWLKFWPKVGLANHWIFSLAVTLVLKKKVYRPYLGHFKPELAQILAKGRPG